MRLPDSPHALAAALPDVPCWVETRSLLLSGDALVRVSAEGSAALVMDATFPSGSLVGHADAGLLRGALADVGDDFELVVQMDALPAVREALPGWTVSAAIVHALAQPYEGGRPPADVAVSAPPDARRLEGLPEDVRQYAAEAEAIAVRVVDGSAVAVCAAGDVTETLWDVGIDTVEHHRRQGHAVACYHALASHMAARGRQPVWSAYEDYPPSLALAAKLGFRPVDRVAVLSQA